MHRSTNVIILLACALFYAVGFGPTLHRLHAHGPGGSCSASCGVTAGVCHAEGGVMGDGPADGDTPAGPGERPAAPLGDDCQVCVFLAAGRDADVPTPIGVVALGSSAPVVTADVAEVRGFVARSREASPRGPPSDGLHLLIF